MEFPYFAVLWNPLEHPLGATVARVIRDACSDSWHPALLCDGLVVCTRTPAVPYLQAQPLNGNCGIILGVLFDRHRNHRVSSRELAENSHLAQRCLDTGGRHLTRNFWGAYVAFISNHHTGEWAVLRDCSGMVPCYYTTTRNVTIVSSDVENFLALTVEHDAYGPLLPLEINWQYVAGFLAHSQIQVRDTGLKHIQELLAGEALSHRDKRVSVELAWSPEPFIEAGPPKSIDAQGAMLRHVLQGCIDAWARVHDWVILSLSGGFDSSLVLAILNRSANRPHLVCVTRFSSGPAEDERRFARMAAQAADTPLVESPWNFGNQRLDVSCLTGTVLAKPSLSALLSPFEAGFLNALRSAHTVDAIWTGEGGDHLFLALKMDLSVTDFVHSRGLGRGLLNTLQDSARLTGQSIPHLAISAVRSRWFHPDPVHKTAALPNFLRLAHVLPDTDVADYIQHPWNRVTTHFPPGKRQQIDLLAEVIHRNRPLHHAQEAVELHPLLSQPVIEQCLRIPTYELLHGGRTRGLARHAFAKDIPTQILNRELKGQTTHHVLDVLERSMPFVTEILTDGVLMQHGMLDQTTLRPLLTHQCPINSRILFSVFATVAAETWARTWLCLDLSKHVGRTTRSPFVSSTIREREQSARH